MITGLTDTTSQSNLLSAILHKGSRKPQGGYLGRDLNQYFRLELKDTNLRSLMREMQIPTLETALKTDEEFRDSYKTKDGKYSLPATSPDDYAVKSLDVFLLTDDLEKTFPHSMQIWDASGLVQQCDRHTIFAQRQEYDHVTGKRSRMDSCQIECPMRDQPLQLPCENGCDYSGTLYFYIPQFLDAGTNNPCRLHIKSLYDFQSILASLAKIKEEFGSLTSSGNFPSVRGSIPLVLKRVKLGIKRPVVTNDKVSLGGKQISKRTGKKADGHIWVVSLEVNPIWAKAYYAWQQQQRLLSMGLPASQELIQLIPGVDFKALSPAPTATPPQDTFDYEQKLQESDRLIEQLNWNSQASRNFLLELTGKKARSLLTLEEWETFLAALHNRLNYDVVESEIVEDSDELLDTIRECDRIKTMLNWTPEYYKAFLEDAIGKSTSLSFEDWTKVLARLRQSEKALIQGN